MASFLQVRQDMQLRKSTRRLLAARPFRPTLETLEARLVLSGDPVLRWNDLANDAVKVDHTNGNAEQGGPTRTARALAMVHVAIYDAVNAIDRMGASYVSDIPASVNASVEVAVAAAAHDTLSALYLNQQAVFDRALAQVLAETPDGPAETEGLAVGRQAAQGILALRSEDNSRVANPYTVNHEMGFWEPDPLHPTQKALNPDWGLVQPFVLQSSSQFRAPAPPAVGSPEYTAAFNEVKNLGGDGVHTPTQRTPEQTLIGIFWGYDGSPGLGTPPRLYNQIAQIVAQQQGNTVKENARLFALINLAMADAGIASWETKYTYNVWRPITAIRRADGDGNPNTLGDPNWMPLGAPQNNGGGDNFTPPFPAYTSGHATFGAALFRTLTDFYGTDRITFSVTSDEFNGMTRDQNNAVRPIATRTYTSFSQAAEENGQSRIYLGIHWAFDKTRGIAQGTAVGDFVSQHALRPFSQAERFVNELYRELLGRNAERAGLEFWSSHFSQGASRTEVASEIQHSLEYRSRGIELLYQRLLDRSSDAAGLGYFLGTLAAGGTFEQIERTIYGSQEYYATQGGSNPMGFLESVYHDILGRSVDTVGGRTFGLMMIRNMPHETIAGYLQHSLEGMQRSVMLLYQEVLGRDAEAQGLNFWVNHMPFSEGADAIKGQLLGSDEFLGRIQ